MSYPHESLILSYAIQYVINVVERMLWGVNSAKRINMGEPIIKALLISLKKEITTCENSRKMSSV